MSTRLPSTAYTAQPWRLHRIAPDFQVEDVWELSTPGGPDDLARLVEQFANGSGEALSAPVPRFLFAVRWKLGKLLGWDGSGAQGPLPTLRDRLPADLSEGPRGPDLRAVPLTSVYLTHDEWVTELANRTVQAAMHIGWVPDGSGGYGARMTVLVKPNGRFGVLYMAAIRPFRYLGVYPAMLRAIGRSWQTAN
ncbi:DUF2867 domain-containing protein [Kitasatospora sp. NPDC058170]|uniref:DUF2867 domain-containing protein n=1 Tax=Kitasatospora sp. NPDC058170 TaxID=3346364 RepID=UPI0036DDCFDE